MTYRLRSEGRSFTPIEIIRDSDAEAIKRVKFLAGCYNWTLADLVLERATWEPVVFSEVTPND